MASTAVTVPNRLVTPMISTSGAAALAGIGATDPAFPLVVSGASEVREAVNGGPRASVPVADHPRSRATGPLHRRGGSSARQRTLRANLAGLRARHATMDGRPEPILQAIRSGTHVTRWTRRAHGRCGLAPEAGPSWRVCRGPSTGIERCPPPRRLGR